MHTHTHTPLAGISSISLVSRRHNLIIKIQLFNVDYLWISSLKLWYKYQKVSRSCDFFFSISLLSNENTILDYLRVVYNDIVMMIRRDDRDDDDVKH